MDSVDMKSDTKLEWDILHRVEIQGNSSGLHESPEDASKDATILRRKLRSKHPKFWYGDGSVVIRVEHTIFRLHLSTLKSKSEFFSNLFARKDGTGTEEVEGCPLFDLDGRACNFTALLDALYGDLTALVGKVPSFFTLACLLRASHRWEFPVLRAWALDALHKRWSSSTNSVNEPKGLDAHALKVIVLSRECDEKSLLKRAFYQLLQLKGLGLSFESDINLTAGEGSIKRSDEYCHEPTKWHPDDSKLSHDDILRVIMLQAHVMDAWKALVCKSPSYKFLSDYHGGKKPSCREIFSTAWHQRVTEAPNMPWSDPLGCWSAIADISWTREGVCESCSKNCLSVWASARIRFWKELDNVLSI
ncbi:hypothetical protein BOTBODRAFT_175846 [Botryobasidium botryosum FD-172 SS1]|uniref:BTB domain-containing protein n=1 Tax=Botryobasidium botryosum (strain FD-172 SS1) TaxID=930990 RepID=A0A067MBW8_BOTB1|nr:hypothetical protein BOTBODRAFT_175846 [Botryobasidium botryosum FD-172 SS1]